MTDAEPEKEFLELCDAVFLGIYSVEMLVKVIAYGVHCGEGSYWFNGWAIFEGFIVFVSWTPFLPLPTLPHSLQSTHAHSNESVSCKTKAKAKKE